MASLSFTKASAKRFAEAYNNAVLSNKAEFKFEEHQLVTAYAYYLLEHISKNHSLIDGEFNNNKTFKIK